MKWISDATFLPFSIPDVTVRVQAAVDERLGGDGDGEGGCAECTGRRTKSGIVLSFNWQEISGIDLEIIVSLYTIYIIFLCLSLSTVFLFNLVTNICKCSL